MKKMIMSKVNKAVNFVRREWFAISAIVFALLSPVNVASATAEDKWNATIDFIKPWITRLGGVVILIGAVEFGLAWKNDDPEKKTQGMRTVIAGCIVFAVGLSADTFLA